MNVVYTLPDMSHVNVRRDIPFAAELLMDVYRPPDDVDEASRTFGFVNGTAGRTLDEIRTNLPLFLARAGQDQTPRLN